VVFASDVVFPPAIAPARVVPPAVSARAPEGESAEPAEVREARQIDELVSANRIGEAHTLAMAFVQRHPSGPYAQHVMNLMGVHPRPPGAVAEVVSGTDEGR
jgi:hypothetical protein